MLCKEAFAGIDNFKSYYLKTVFLWCCEKMPRKFWKPRNHADCFYALIDDLLLCLSKGNLQNYFVKDSNLLSHLNPKDLQNMVPILVDLRRRPVYYMNRWHNAKNILYNESCPFSLIMEDIIELSTMNGNIENQSIIDHQSLKIMWYFISREIQTYSLDTLRNHFAFSSDRRLSFLHYICLNDWYLFGEESKKNLGSIFAAFKVMFNLNLSVSEVQRWMQSSLELSLSSPKVVCDSKHCMDLKICYSVFMYCTGAFEVAYQIARSLVSEIDTDENEGMMRFNPALAMCSLINDVCLYIPVIEVPPSVIRTYIYVKSGKKAGRPIDVQKVNSYLQTMDIIVEGRDDYCMPFFAASTYLDMNQFLLATVQILNCYSHFTTALIRVGLVYNCILLELLCARANFDEVNTELFTKLVNEIIQHVNNENDIYTEMDSIPGILLDLAAIYRTTHTRHTIHAQCKCAILQCTASLTLNDSNVTLIYDCGKYMANIGLTPESELCIKAAEVSHWKQRELLMKRVRSMLTHRYMALSSL